MHAPEIDGKVFVNDFPRNRLRRRAAGRRILSLPVSPKRHEYDLVAKIL